MDNQTEATVRGEAQPFNGMPLENLKGDTTNPTPSQAPQSNPASPLPQTPQTDPEPRDFTAPPSTQEEGLSLNTAQLLNTLIEGQTVLVSVKFLTSLIREAPQEVVTRFRQKVHKTPTKPTPQLVETPLHRGRIAGRFKVRDLRLTGRNWNESMNAVYQYTRNHPEGVTVRETSDDLQMPLSTAHNCLRKLLKKQALRWVKG